MSGGHWGYLSHKIEERVGAPLDDIWRMLAAIEHELDWGICCDTCYDCAKIRVVNALEAYFDTDATSVDNALRLLHSSESECVNCDYSPGSSTGASRDNPRLCSPTARMFKAALRSRSMERRQHGQ